MLGLPPHLRPGSVPRVGGGSRGRSRLRHRWPDRGPSRGRAGAGAGELAILKSDHAGLVRAGSGVRHELAFFWMHQHALLSGITVGEGESAAGLYLGLFGDGLALTDLRPSFDDVGGFRGPFATEILAAPR